MNFSNEFIVFRQTAESLRRIGARGGRAYGRNRRAHQKLQLSVRAFRQVSKEIHGPAGGRVSHLEAPAGIESVGANTSIMGSVRAMLASEPR